MNATVQGTEWLNKKQLEQLAKDDKNRVYTYTYDKPQSSLSADVKRDRIREIRERFLFYRQSHPEWDDDKIRHYICSEKYAWRDFAKAYSTNFSSVTNRETDDAKMQYHYYMLYVEKQIESGFITQEQSRAMVTEYFLKESMKKAKPQNHKSY